VLLADLADAASRAGRTVVLISHAAVDESLVDRVVTLHPSSPLTALHAGV